MRIPDDLWEWVQAMADDEETSATEIVLRAIRAYKRAHDYYDPPGH